MLIFINEKVDDILLVIGVEVSSVEVVVVLVPVVVSEPLKKIKVKQWY